MNFALSDFIVGSELGRGTFGITYKATYIPTNEIVVLKMIDIENSKLYGSNIDDIKYEVNLLSNLSTYGNCNNHVVCYYGMFEDVYKGRAKLIIITELIDGISLDNYINNLNRLYPGTNPPIKLVWNIMRKLAQGLVFIHNKGIAHRDIKPNNIMVIEKEDEEDVIVKYIDFGLSCNSARVLSGEDTCAKAKGGTLVYMAPEQFKPDSIFTKNFKTECANDVWGLAITFVNLTENDTYPFHVPENVNPITMEQLLSNPRNIRPSYYRPTDRTYNKIAYYTIRYIISTMLIYKYELRPNITDILRYMDDELNFTIPLTRDHMAQDLARRGFNKTEQIRLLPKSDLYKFYKKITEMLDFNENVNGFRNVV